MATLDQMTTQLANTYTQAKLDMNKTALDNLALQDFGSTASNATISETNGVMNQQAQLAQQTAASNQQAQTQAITKPATQTASPTTKPTSTNSGGNMAGTISSVADGGTTSSTTVKETQAVMQQQMKDSAELTKLSMEMNNIQTALSMMATQNGHINNAAITAVDTVGKLMNKGFNKANAAVQSQ